MALPSTTKLALPKFKQKPHLLIVAAPYQIKVVDLLKHGAKQILKDIATHELIDVPGALEIPTAIRIAAFSDKFDGFVALGCVIRGDTTHYETVCNESARGLTLLGLSGCCIGNGILTLENISQGLDRADPNGSDKGGEAAAAALHLLALTKQFSTSSQRFGFQLQPDSRVS